VSQGVESKNRIGGGIMRYAVPMTDGRLAAHFGHCEHFVMIDVDEEAKTIVRKEIVASPGHQPGFLPGWLAEEGVTAVIAGGMGMRAQELFAQNRIRVIIGALGDDPEQVVLDCLRGTLATGENICDH
jgi:predicted Fe-Mo cluster-binding NifX family protein